MTCQKQIIKVKYPIQNVLMIIKMAYSELDDSVLSELIHCLMSVLLEMFYMINKRHADMYVVFFIWGLIIEYIFIRIFNFFSQYHRIDSIDCT